MPWGAAQTEAFQAVISALITHPVLAVPDWNLPFALHTDASELAAGAVLTQEVENREAPLGYASHRFTRTEEKLSPNDREVLGVLYGIKQFHTYLQHRRFALFTDCAALTWLFTSQNLSSKMHRWSMRLMQSDIDLKWRRAKTTQPLTPCPACDAKDHRSRPSTPPFRTTRRARWKTKGPLDQCWTEYRSGTSPHQRTRRSPPNHLWTQRWTCNWTLMTSQC